MGMDVNSVLSQQIIISIKTESFKAFPSDIADTVREAIKQPGRLPTFC
jgi:hypothetical protein